jgi:hypothetical protein
MQCHKIYTVAFFSTATQSKYFEVTAFSDIHTATQYKAVTGANAVRRQVGMELRDVCHWHDAW